MIDIHCHILPEIDDGAQSRTMSFKMCQTALQSGVSDIIATPHMLDVYGGSEFHEKVTVRLEFLNALMRERGMDLRIHRGAEVYASQDILYSPNLSEYTLAGSRYLLTEFDFGTATLAYVKEVIAVIQSQDLIPLIAHPERYAFTQADYENINRLADCGALFQANIGSLTGELGRKSQKLAFEMMEKGAVSFLASDAHRVEFRNTDFNAMIEGLKAMKKSPNLSDLELLLEENPRKILAGDPVQNPSFPTLKKRLF